MPGERAKVIVQGVAIGLGLSVFTLLWVPILRVDGTTFEWYLRAAALVLVAGFATPILVYANPQVVEDPAMPLALGLGAITSLGVCLFINKASDLVFPCFIGIVGGTLGASIARGALGQLAQEELEELKSLEEDAETNFEKALVPLQRTFGYGFRGRDGRVVMILGILFFAFQIVTLALTWGTVGHVPWYEWVSLTVPILIFLGSGVVGGMLFGWMLRLKRVRRTHLGTLAILATAIPAMAAGAAYALNADPIGLIWSKAATVWSAFVAR